MRRALVATGALVIGYAVLGGLADPDIRPVAHLVFLAAVLLAHDAVLLPLMLGIAVLIRRYLPASSRAPVQLAGFVTVTLAVVAIPLTLGFGRRADEPSALPLAYGRGFAILLLVVWAAALTAVVRERRLVRRTRIPPAMNRAWTARRVRR